jgi:hypothetical protein
MYPSLVLSAALIAPAAPVPRDTVPSAPGPAPRVLAVKADATGTVRVIGHIPMKVTVTNTFFTVENNKQVQKNVEQDVLTTQHFNKTLAEYNGKFSTADGTPLTADEANGRLKNGATLLASADGKPVAKAWLRAVSPDTVVMVAEGFAHVQPQWGSAPMPSTPAPRLTMLGTDETGKLLAPCTSAPLDSNGANYGDMMFEGRAQFRGRIRESSYYPHPQPMDVKVVLKPLADVKFEAYDLGGKRISRTETLKRLAAGGLVVVAGDNRMPDADYLKGFREDVIVLTGPELVIPVAPVDQTKKKQDKDKEPKAQPNLPALPPGPLPAAPVVRPAIIIQAAPVKAAPVQKEEAKPEKK